MGEPSPTPTTETARYDAHAELASDVVYGPVPSRRYGVTLGLNLLPPGQKLCTFRCTYCQLGPERPHHGPAPWPTPAHIADALQAALTEPRGVDALVISGNGEPTLHPDLHAVLASIVAARDAWLPGRPIVLLTAGTELHRPDVRAALALLDEVAVKLDAGTQGTFARLDMPWQTLDLDALTDAMALLPRPTVQTILTHGRVDNTTPDEVAAWLARLERIQPGRVDLYTVDRRPVDKQLRQVPMRVARAIATQVEAAGWPCRAFAPEEPT